MIDISPEAWAVLVTGIGGILTGVGLWLKSLTSNNGKALPPPLDTPMSLMEVRLGSKELHNWQLLLDTMIRVALGIERMAKAQEEMGDAREAELASKIARIEEAVIRKNNQNMQRRS